MSQARAQGWTQRIRVLRRSRVAAFLGLLAVGAAAAFYVQRYSAAICPGGGRVEQEGGGEPPHDDFFGCVFENGGYEEGNVWTNRVFMGFLAACALLAFVLLNAAWQLSAARYYAARERVEARPRVGRAGS